MKPPRIVPFLVLAFLAALGVASVRAEEPAEAAPEPEAEPVIIVDGDDRVGVGSPVHVPSDESLRGDAVGIGTRIEIDGAVRGDVVGIGSRILVRGEVGGDVVGVASHIELAPGARVGGEVVNVLGTLDNQGAEVSRVMDMSPGVSLPAWGHLPIGILGFFSLWWKLLVLALVFVVLLLHTALVPERVRTISDETPVRPVVAFLAGLMGYAALVVVSFFLAVTLIGIPLAILLYFAFKILQWLGFAGIFHYVGRRIGRSLGRDLSTLGAVVVGFLPFALLRFLPFCTGWLIWFVLEVVAIGFVILTRAGTRGTAGTEPPPVLASPPAPIPQGPGIPGAPVPG